MVSSAYTYVDFDNDGDLDLISTTVNGPIKVFVNNQTANHSVAVALRDYRGNRFGIGSKVFIYYGDGRAQLRELKSGGGFISIDAAVAYFGLGAHQVIDKMEVIWSTGEKTQHSGPFQAGAKYTLTRR